MQVYGNVSPTSSAPGRAPLYRARQVGNALALTLGDLLGLGLGLALVAGPLTPEGGGFPAWTLGAAAVWGLGAPLLGLTPGWGLGAPGELRRLWALTLLVFVSTAGGLLTAHRVGAGGVTWLALGLLAAWVLTAGLRALVRHLLIRAGGWGVPVAVYGGGQTGALLVATLQEHPGYGYRPAGVFDDHPALHGTRLGGVPVLGPTSQALVEAPVAVLALPGAGRERVRELLEGPLRPYRRVIVVPDLFEVESLWVTARDLGGVLGLEVTRPLLSPLTCAGKRAFDLAVVVLSAPFWLPLCAVIALAIRLEGAPPLFLQPRVGRGGEPFTTWKFRTMRPDAESVLQQALARDPALRKEWETTFKLRRDPRVTRLGALLRKTSLDELPQLVNVLRGEMSLVGPRPLPAYHHAGLPRQVQELRERVRPGMTGLWQVSGRSASGNAGMERWDPYYVRNWSPWLDLVILLRTVQVVLRGSGAY